MPLHLAGSLAGKGQRGESSLGLKLQTGALSTVVCKPPGERKTDQKERPLGKVQHKEKRKRGRPAALATRPPMASVPHLKTRKGQHQGKRNRGTGIL